MGGRDGIIIQAADRVALTTMPLGQNLPPSFSRTEYRARHTGLSVSTCRLMETR